MVVRRWSGNGEVVGCVVGKVVWCGGVGEDGMEAGAVSDVVDHQHATVWEPHCVPTADGRVAAN